MVTKKRTKKKTFWETYKGKIKTTLIAAICTALGVWMFTMVKGGCESIALSVDQKYNNASMKPEIDKRLADVEKKMEVGDDLVAQQSVKTFEMYQQKLETQTKEAQRKADMNKLEDYKRQKVLVEKESTRDPKNQYLKDQIEYLKRQIQMLEEKLYK
jgi:hypothetical protein